MERKERAVRLVLDSREADGGRRGVCTRVGGQRDDPADTLRGWVQRAEIDGGLHPGTASDDVSCLAALDLLPREVGEPAIG